MQGASRAPGASRGPGASWGLSLSPEREESNLASGDSEPAVCKQDGDCFEGLRASIGNLACWVC